MATTWGTYQLAQLRLDQENYRTGPQSDQRSAIRAIIDDQKEKLVNLARHLKDAGPSPGDPIWIFPVAGSPDTYTVAEGNRRVAALKILDTPELASGKPEEAAFRELAKQYAAKPIRELYACVFENREEAKPWIRLRHLSGNSGVGLERWAFLAQGRALRDHELNAPRALAVFELLQDDESDEWAEIQNVLDTRWTTVDRVLNAKAIRDSLGVIFDGKSGVINFENGDQAAGKALLHKIVSRMASPDFEFSEVEKVEDRETFLGQFASDSVKAKTTSLPPPPPGPPSPPSQPSPPPPPKGRPTFVARKTLAPKSAVGALNVKGARLGPLYKECRSISVGKNKNASALLLRVFLELSTEAYLTDKKIPLPKGKSGTWSDQKLADKIGTVIHNLDSTGTDKRFDQARLSIQKSTRSDASITTLHGYFHNLNFLPDATQIMAAWDAWEGYLQALHDAL